MHQANSQFATDVELVAPDTIAFAPENLALTGYEVTSESPVESWQYRYVKRGIDLVGSLILVLLFAIPGCFVAAAILLTSPGGVFYREERIGRYGRTFRIWKFRSMCQNAAQLKHIERSGKVLEWRMKKHVNDPRITRVGAFIRRWSIDEMPQLFNVVRGDMSLIGPRPIVQSEADRYNHMLPFYLAATPGMSGLWQVSGRCEIDYDKRALLDASYVQTWSLGIDFSILLKTIPAVLSRVGAC